MEANGVAGNGSRHLHFVLVVDVAIAHAPARRFRPQQVVDRIDALQIHRDAFETIGYLARYRSAVQTTDLLEVGELGDFHTVQPHLPTESPGTQGRRLPVVFDEAHIMHAEIDAKRAQRFEVELLDVVG